VETLDYKTQFERMKKDATAALSKALDVQSAETSRRVVVKDVWIDDNRDEADFESQRQALRKDQTWGVPVYASLDLVDRKSGEVMSSTKRIRVATLPKSTTLGSFIVNGKHYQIQSQFRRKPGMYITERANRQRKAEINIASKPFDIEQDPQSGVFNLFRGPKSKTPVPLYPVLSALGISDQMLARTWGQKILDANKAAAAKDKGLAAVKRATEYLTRTQVETAEEGGKAMNAFFEGTELSPGVTQDTVGKAYERVTPEAVLKASAELLKAERGERPVDDRQALQFKKVLSPADLFRERLLQTGGELAAPLAELRKRVHRRLSNRNKPPTQITQVVDVNEFSPIFDTFFTSSALANPTDQTNPINMLNGLSKITVLGPGAVKDESKARAEERSVHPSHLGFLDPIHTPDSGRIGLVTNLPLGVVKSGDELKTRVRDLRKGSTRFISPAEMKQMVVAFPDQYERGKPIDSKVKAMVQGEVRLVDPKEVDVVLASAKQAFSISSNSIPFLPAAQGVRAQMATKMLEQAIPLAQREAPLVQVKLGDETVEDTIGKAFSIQALEDGVVEQVTPNRIVLRTKEGRVEQVLYNNLPLNGKSFLHAEPLADIKVGAQVKKGQVLADSNFTRNGTLAIGTNLRAAYIPYKGMTIEDGIVVTESAARKLSSEHMHKFAVPIEKGTELSFDQFMGWRPNDLTLDQQGKLDADGVVKRGQILKKDDPMWVGVRENKYDQDAIAMRKLAPTWSPKRGYRENWTGDTDGEVVDVVKHGKTVKVFVRTLEPAVIGDKLTGRHGEKGIITKIIPDGEAPKTADDEPVDILLNPHGVVSRINPSQILETAAGKVATKAGKPYVVDNFSGENYTQKVMDDLAKTGLQDTEPLFDPHSKEPLGNVLVGNKYVLKLAKQATEQYSARAPEGGSYDVNLAPAGRDEDKAKSLDLMAFYSLLSHGSRANLQEMATYKTSSNPEFWRWIATGGKGGLVKPPPEPSFAYKKFEAYMKGAGVNMERRGSLQAPRLALGPMTNREVENLTSGAVQDAVFMRAKDLKDDVGGLTDPYIFGAAGDRWGHLDLSEPIPNPVFEEPIKRLTGLKDSQFTSLVRGELFLNPETGEWGAKGGLTGGAALRHLLGQIDVDQQIGDWTDKAKHATKPAQLDEANKNLRYLHGLRKMKLRPEEAYIQDKIPVIPKRFRPVIPMPDGTLTVGGVNNLYRDITLINNELKWQQRVPFLPDSIRADLRSNLYDGIKALTGLGEPIAQYTEARKPQGFITQIKGKPAKQGLFQRKVLRRAQEPVARGTIIPDPKLGMDEVGLPEEMAWNVFEPFLVRRLVTTAGKSPTDASAEVRNRTPLARDALQIEMEERPIWLNRAPSLHKFSIQSFKPKLTDGRAIKIPPLAIKGFNADFNGDSVQPSESLVVSVDGRILNTTFGEFAGLVTNGATEDEQIELAKGVTAILKLRTGVEVLSWMPGVGICWRPADEFTIHTSHGPAYEVVTHTGRRVTVSEHHNFGVLDQDLVWQKIKTDKLQAGTLIPFIRTLPERTEKIMTLDLCPGHTIQLDYWAGWFFGYFAGDGSITGRTDTISLASGDNRKHPLLADILRRVGFKPWDEPGRSVRATHRQAAMAMKKLFGHRAENKKIPGFILQSPDVCREGFVAGFIDAEGNIGRDSNDSLHVRIEVTSKILLEGFSWLLSTLGVGCYLREGKCATEKNQKTYVLEIARNDLEDLPSLLFEDKNVALMSGLDRDRRVIRSRYDLVPFCRSLAAACCERGRHKRVLTTERLSYKAKEIRKYGELGYLTRDAAIRVIQRYGELDHPLFATWKALVDDTTTGWTLIKSVTEVDRPRVMYDFSVPEGNETFAVAGGLITRNTMTVHVPILPDAVKEAYNALPSRNLYNPGTGQIMVQPQNEAALGLYLMTSDPEQRQRVLENVPESLRDKYKSRVLDSGGLRELLNDMAQSEGTGFPAALQRLKVLGDDYTYKKGFTIGLKDLVPQVPGREQIFQQTTEQIRKLDMKKPEHKQRAAEILTLANKELNQAVDKGLAGTGNSLHLMVKSGARGNMNQLKQIVSAPFMVEDYKGDPIPIPITRSFAEGLSFSDYWNTTYGARQVATDKQLQTQYPGAFTKDLMATTINNVISKDDCKTSEGIKLPVSERTNDLESRFVAGDIKVGGRIIAHSGEPVTAGLLNFLRDHRIKEVKVRSPLTCKQPEGTCSTCYGLNEDGQHAAIGDNVGAISGQSLSEPLTQMTLRTFHSGGIAGTRGAISGYEKIDKLLKMPQIKRGKATLATADGKVERVEPSDTKLGINVWLSGHKKAHFVPNDVVNHSKIRVGTEVKKGDAISDGLIHPDDLLKHKGMLEAQQYIVDQLQDAYKGQGVALRRRAIETVVRSVTNTTRVTDPGDSGFLPGDVAPWTVVQDYNHKSLGQKPVQETEGLALREDLPGLPKGTIIDESARKILERLGKTKVEVGPRPIKDEPFLKGVTRIPLLREDWMSQMGYQNLAKAIIGGATKMRESELHGYSPIPAFAYGAEFGEAPSRRSEHEGVY
jgi:DNA-directed RNA polymerase beta subunit/DNA-directed RNA polymerase beta' subunit